MMPEDQRAGMVELEYTWHLCSIVPCRAHKAAATVGDHGYPNLSPTITSALQIIEGMNQ